MRFVPLNSECILTNIEPGTSFITTAIENSNSVGTFFYIFGKDKRGITYYGYKEDDLIDVKCTILKNDITLGELYQDPKYSSNSIDYLLYVKVNDDKTLWPMIIEPNIKMFNMCFPYGADAELFWDKDFPEHGRISLNDEGKMNYNEEKIFYKGDRRGYICRLKIEKI